MLPKLRNPLLTPEDLTPNKDQPGTFSIPREKAIALFDACWWDGQADADVAEFQLRVDELSMPFDVFQDTVERVLGRGVQTIEFGMMRMELIEELMGKKAPPTIQEVLNSVTPRVEVIMLRAGEPE